MRGILTFLLITILGLLISFGFYFDFGAGNITDFLVAKAIPRYPNASSWQVTAGIGFPDGEPEGDIDFHTNDTAESVLDFYKTELVKRGWKITYESASSLATYMWFTKQFGGMNFSAYVDVNQSIYVKLTSTKEENGHISIMSHVH